MSKGIVMARKDDITRQIAAKREEIRRTKQKIGDARKDPTRLERINNELTKLNRELSALLNHPDYR